jgi:xylulose-5-phosphate/fructose-6-phosphate phosphoketolase
MTTSTKTLSPELLHKISGYWRAANYLSVSVGQIYLYDNPLLKRPLELADIKPRLVGHWGTTPGLNFIYVHLNRVIKQHDLDVIYITGRATVDQGWWRTPTLKAPTARYIPTSHNTRTV